MQEQRDSYNIDFTEVKLNKVRNTYSVTDFQYLNSTITKTNILCQMEYSHLRNGKRKKRKQTGRKDVDRVKEISEF